MSKGTRREREAVGLWKRAGFAVYRPATVQYGENDIFGLFDVLAVSPRHDTIHAVQVKSNSATGLMAWKGHTALFRALGCTTLYAVPKDSEGWVIYDAGQEPEDARRAAKVVVDERDHDDVGPHVDTAHNTGHGVVDWLDSIAGSES